MKRNAGAFNNRFFFLLLLLGSYRFGECQQSSISGVVSIHNSETNYGIRKFVSNAKVLDDLNRANLKLTDRNGFFTLTYVGVGNAESVNLVVVKENLQVVNVADLNAITGQLDLVKISMAHPDSINEYRRRIYNIGKMLSEKKLEAKVSALTEQLKKLRARNENNAQRISDLQSDSIKLASLLEESNEKATELARKYAAINLDDVSPIYRKAFMFFQKGELDSSISIINSVNLKSQVNDILEERERIRRIRLQISQEDTIQLLSSENAAKTLLLNIDLQKTALNFVIVHESYNDLLRLDSTNPSYHFDYGIFLLWENRSKTAEFHFLKAISILNSSNARLNPIDRDLMLAKIHYNLSKLYLKTYEYHKAKVSCDSALMIYSRTPLRESNETIYRIAGTYNNLGNVFFKTGDHFRAEECYHTVHNLLEKLRDKRVSNTNLSGLEAGLKINIGKLDEAKKRPNLSLNNYNEAVDISRSLAGKNYRAWGELFAEALINRGQFYLGNGKLELSTRDYNDAKKIIDRLILVKEDAYRPQLFQLKIWGGDLMFSRAQYAKADSMYKDGEGIYKGLSSEEKASLLEEVSVLYNNMASMSMASKSYADCQNYFLKSISAIEELSNKHMHIDSLRLARIYNNLSDLYIKQDNEQAAKPYILKVISLSNNSTFDTFDPIQIQLIRAKHYFSKVLLNEGDANGSISAAKEALLLGENLYERHFLNDASLIGIQLSNLGEIYLNTGDTTNAEHFLAEAISWDEKTMSENIGGTETANLPRYSYTLGRIKAKRNNYEGASKYLAKAVVYFQKLYSTNQDIFNDELGDSELWHGIVNFHLKNYSIALESFNSALPKLKIAASRDINYQQGYNICFELIRLCIQLNQKK